jgi:hypothetical protein
MTTVTATRTVPGDPASTALLLAGPSALEFWPGISHVDGLLSPLAAHAALAGQQDRRLIIRAQPPRRTPTAYVTTFSVDADGLPSASGTLRVTRQDWIGGPPPVPEQKNSASPPVPATKLSGPTASISLELRTDEDYDTGTEQEILAQATAFLDNIAAFASASQQLPA